MAEESETNDKTEEPTQKRLEEALKRGDVVKSQEVNTWFVIGAGTLVLLTFSGPMSVDLNAMMRGILANAAAASTNQALTSWLLTTSPRLIASSSRF